MNKGDNSNDHFVPSQKTPVSKQTDSGSVASSAAVEPDWAN